MWKFTTYDGCQVMAKTNKKNPKIKEFKLQKNVTFSNIENTWGDMILDMYNQCRLTQSSRNVSVLSDMTSKRTDTRLVFCNRKLMRTDIFFTRANKLICNFANSVDRLKKLKWRPINPVSIEKWNTQSRKLARDRLTASDKFPDGPVVFVNLPHNKLFCQPLPFRIDQSRFSVNST